MRGDKDKWVKRKGTCINVSIGSNCNCWMCKIVMKWIDDNHWTTGKEREKFAEKLISHLAYKMGYAGCEDEKTYESTLPERKH